MTDWIAFTFLAIGLAWNCYSAIRGQFHSVSPIEPDEHADVQFANWQNSLPVND